MHEDPSERRAAIAEFQLGDWRVEPAAGTISRGGASVRLEPKVMDVLVFLVAGGGAVVRKNEILEGVWADAVVEEAALNRCISELRRGLGDDAKNPRYIETIPKRGYRVIAEISAPAVEASPPAARASARANAAEPAQTPAPDAGASGAIAPAAASAARRWRWAVPWVLVAVLAAILLVSGVGRRSTELAEVGPIASVAVLPVQNLSGDPDQDYLAEGITDALITELGRISAFGKVTSRASAMAYNEADVPAPEIGERLGVDGLIEASVVSAADVVRVNVRLVHAASDTQVWSESFERQPRDIGALYGEVAEAIARQAEVDLTAQERARIRSSRPVDPEAHAAYLRGRHFWNRRTPNGFRRAREYFERAIEIDPDYAVAHVGLADAYFISEQPSPMESTRMARESLATALELDESLAEAHASLAFVLVFDWQWDAAEKEFRRAIELNPGYATAHQWYGLMLSWTGRFDESVDELRRARELDPLSPLLVSAEGITNVRAGRLERGIELLHEALELDSGFVNARSGLAKAYLRLGRPADAVEELEIAVETADPAAAELLAMLGMAYAAAGRRADAEAVLTRLDALGVAAWRVSSLPFYVAGIYAQLEDTERAFQYLEQAFAEGAPDLVTIRVEESLGPLRADPRFDDLMRRMGLPPAG